VQDRSTRKSNRRRDSDCYWGDQRLAIESGDQRSRGGKGQGKQRLDAQVNLEQVRSQSPIDPFLLDHGLGNSIQPEIDEQEAEGGHHGNQPEVTWSQQSSQDHCGEHLDRHGEPSGQDGDSGASNGYKT